MGPATPRNEPEQRISADRSVPKTFGANLSQRGTNCRSDPLRPRRRSAGSRDEVAARVQRGDKPKPAEVRQISPTLNPRRREPRSLRLRSLSAMTSRRRQRLPHPIPARSGWRKSLQQFERDVLSVDPADLLRNAADARGPDRIRALAAGMAGTRLSECAGPVGRSLDEARADRSALDPDPHRSPGRLTTVRIGSPCLASPTRNGPRPSRTPNA